MTTLNSKIADYQTPRDTTDTPLDLQTQVNLKDMWVPSLRAAIKTCLDSVSKGWFNTEETNYEVYQGSKLKKLMELIKFAMQVRVCVCMYIHYVRMCTGSGTLK